MAVPLAQALQTTINNHVQTQADAVNAQLNALGLNKTSHPGFDEVTDVVKAVLAKMRTLPMTKDNQDKIAEYLGMPLQSQIDSSKCKKSGYVQDKFGYSRKVSFDSKSGKWWFSFGTGEVPLLDATVGTAFYTGMTALMKSPKGKGNFCDSTFGKKTCAAKVCKLSSDHRPKRRTGCLLP